MVMGRYLRGIGWLYMYIKVIYVCTSGHVAEFMENLEKFGMPKRIFAWGLGLSILVNDGISHSLE